MISFSMKRYYEAITQYHHGMIEQSSISIAEFLLVDVLGNAVLCYSSYQWTLSNRNTPVSQGNRPLRTWSVYDTFYRTAFLGVYLFYFENVIVRRLAGCLLIVGELYMASIIQIETMWATNKRLSSMFDFLLETLRSIPQILYITTFFFPLEDLYLSSEERTYHRIVMVNESILTGALLNHTTWLIGLLVARKKCTPFGIWVRLLTLSFVLVPSYVAFSYYLYDGKRTGAWTNPLHLSSNPCVALLWIVSCVVNKAFRSYCLKRKPFIFNECVIEDTDPLKRVNPIEHHTSGGVTKRL